MTVRSKFMKTRTELAASLVERDEEIDLALTALVAKQHLLLVGPPGCAKSLLLDSLMKWAGGSKFAVLLNKYTVPEEVVGPVSVIGLKADRFMRITTGRHARPFFRTAIAATPSSVPCTLPVPPKILVPPSTTAVIAKSS